MKLSLKTKTEQTIFEKFVQRFDLDQEQQEAFLAYADDLVATNQKFNITAILDFSQIIQDHFTDSLALAEACDMSRIASVIDVGSGGGFPAIPLKIAFPHVRVLCVEVNKKKVAFLQEVAEKFEFEDFEVIDTDWRTFLRHNKEKYDLVVARASLSVDELLRMFSPTSVLQYSSLVYWASQKWHPIDKQVDFVDNCYEYRVGDKQRKLIFFENDEEE